MTAISKKSKLNHTSVREHLKQLQQMGIVQEKRFGRIKIYKINENNQSGSRIKEFLRLWKTNE